MDNWRRRGIRLAACAVGAGVLAVTGSPTGAQDLPDLEIANQLLGGAHLPTSHEAPSETPFVGLMGLPDGIPGSRALAMSHDGAVVVGVATSKDGPQAFRWTLSGGMRGLGDLPGGAFSSIATAVSTSGSVVVGYSASSSGAEEAFRWRLGQGMEGLGDLSGGAFASRAADVSSNGSVVVGWATPGANQLEAFRWTNIGGMIGLGELPGGLYASRGMAVSGNGSVVTGWGSSGNFGVNEAFRWTASDGLVGLGFIPDAFLDGSQALDISFYGSVIVGGGWAELGVQAFRWTAAGGMVALGDLPGGGVQPYSIAFGVSADGSTVVGTSNTDAGAEAFVWNAEQGMRNIATVLVDDYGVDLTDWLLVEARAASIFGDIIAGWGFHEGVEEAWIAYLTPPVCPADVNGDGTVNLGDLLILLATLGPCVDCDNCAADIDGDCDVDVADLGEMFGAWGACP